MNLTLAQKTILKVHIALNTNTIIVAGGATVAIKDVVEDGDNYQFIADWYNGVALAGDAQPFAAPLTLWKPLVTVQELNKAIAWGTNPAGATPQEITNSWLKYQSMIWSSAIDLTDGQVRSGIASVFGASGSTAVAIGTVGTGKQDGTRAELLYAGGSVGGTQGLGAGARVTAVFGQKLTGPDIADAKLNG